MTDLTSYALSAAVRNPRLDLFKMPPTDLSMASSREVRLNPVTTGTNPISFELKPIADFIDLDRCYVEVELTLKLTNTNNVVQATRIQLANNLAHTLFKQISVRLNGTLLSPQTNTYHYLAMLQTMLDNDKEDGKNLLAPQGWYNCLDVPSDTDADEITADQQNPGHDDFKALSDSKKLLILNRVKFLGGNKVRLRFTPNLEIFRLGKLLKPEVQLQMDMYLNPPSLWSIRYHGAEEIRLTDDDIKVSFFIQQVRVQPSVHRELVDAMNRGKKGTYTTVRGDLRTYSLQNDNRKLEIDNPFNGKVPNRVVVALVKQTAFNGAITENPFTFGKFNLSSVKLTIAGEEYPYAPLALKHDSGNDDLAGYHRFLQASGCFTRGHGNMVDFEDWGHGKKANLYVFDTTANASLDSPILNPQRKGELRVVLDFGANPGSNLTVLVYGEFENLLEIAGNGTVTYNVHE